MKKRFLATILIVFPTICLFAQNITDYPLISADNTAVQIENGYTHIRMKSVVQQLGRLERGTKYKSTVWVTMPDPKNFTISNDKFEGAYYITFFDHVNVRTDESIHLYSVGTELTSGVSLNIDGRMEIILWIDSNDILQGILKQLDGKRYGYYMATVYYVIGTQSTLWLDRVVILDQ